MGTQNGTVNPSASLGLRDSPSLGDDAIAYVRLRLCDERLTKGLCMRYDPREEYRQYLGWRDWIAQCHQSGRIRILSTVQDPATSALCAQLALDSPTLL